MLDEIMTSEDGNYRVVAEQSSEPDNPRHEENVGIMLAVHPRYDLGDQDNDVVDDLHTVFEHEGAAAAQEWLRTVHGVQVVLPLYLHDHSGLSMRAGQNLLAGFTRESLDWDSSLVGCIFATAESAKCLDWADVERILRAEVATYDLYLRGEVYDLRVQMKVEQHVTTVQTYPSGAEEVHQHTTTAWVETDEPHYTAYGDAEFGALAADLLGDIERIEHAG